MSCLMGARTIQYCMALYNTNWPKPVFRPELLENHGISNRQYSEEKSVKKGSFNSFAQSPSQSLWPLLSSFYFVKPFRINDWNFIAVGRLMGMRDMSNSDSKSNKGFLDIPSLGQHGRKGTFGCPEHTNERKPIGGRFVGYFWVHIGYCAGVRAVPPAFPLPCTFPHSYVHTTVPSCQLGGGMNEWMGGSKGWSRSSTSRYPPSGGRVIYTV